MMQTAKYMSGGVAEAGLSTAKRPICWRWPGGAASPVFVAMLFCRKTHVRLCDAFSGKDTTLFSMLKENRAQLHHSCYVYFKVVMFILTHAAMSLCKALVLATFFTMRVQKCYMHTLSGQAPCSCVLQCVCLATQDCSNLFTCTCCTIDKWLHNLRE